jgi:hypothetical protein
VNEGDYQNVIRSLFVQNDVASVFMAPDACGDRIRDPSHAGVFGKHIKTPGQAISILPSLFQAKMLDAVKEDVKNIVGSAFG